MAFGNSFNGGITADLTAPSTNIGTTTPVAVNSTIFTALPANNASAYVASGSSLTGSNAQRLVDLSQTWNTSGTPTAIFVNLTDTASPSQSFLVQLQRSSSNVFSVRKDGFTIIQIGIGFVNWYNISGGTTIAASGTVQALTNSLTITAAVSIGGNVSFVGEAANNLAQRNGANSQVSRLYKSFIDASNYTRAAWQFDANGVVLAGESAGTGDANIGFSLGIKGTGAFQLQPTDSTAAGGNARGANAVDLQTVRNTASQVASGANSFIAGIANAASADGSVAIGVANVASGISAVAMGISSIASGIYSVALGVRADTKSVRGLLCFATDPISDSAGKNQTGIFNIGAETTSATPKVLTSSSGGASATNQLVLRNNSSIAFFGLATACITGGGDSVNWKIEGGIKRGANAASTALVGTPTITSIGANAGASGWALAITADTTNGCLAATVTNGAGVTVRTNLSLFASEVAF